MRLTWTDSSVFDPGPSSHWLLNLAQHGVRFLHPFGHRNGEHHGCLTVFTTQVTFVLSPTTPLPIWSTPLLDALTHTGDQSLRVPNFFNKVTALFVHVIVLILLPTYKFALTPAALFTPICISYLFSTPFNTITAALLALTSNVIFTEPSVALEIAGVK